MEKKLNELLAEFRKNQPFGSFAACDLENPHIVHFGVQMEPDSLYYEKQQQQLHFTVHFGCSENEEELLIVGAYFVPPIPHLNVSTSGKILAHPFIDGKTPMKSHKFQDFG
jgi:hypothetical protein